MEETMQSITIDFLREKLKSDARPVLVNVLPQEAYVAKHIPGSINIPADQIDWFEKVIPEKQQDIVVYCANAECQASPNTAEKLLEKGYKNVWDFEEGMAGWEEAGYTMGGQDTA